MGRVRRRASGVAAALAGAVVVVVSLAGCGVGDPATVDPSGVDGLVIPTPSPDPADFVRGVDNPWLPLEPGSRWRYRVVVDGAVVQRVTVSVADGTEEVAGVPATVVRQVVRGAGGGPVHRSREWFAQDVDGNVWHLGTAGSWRAGVDGAQAGLAMPATPRVGDGFEREHAPGVAEDRVRVLSLDAEATVPAGTFTPVVETVVTTPLDEGREERAYHARGVGLVREVRLGRASGSASGGGSADSTGVVELVAHTTPVQE